MNTCIIRSVIALFIIGIIALLSIVPITVSAISSAGPPKMKPISRSNMFWSIRGILKLRILCRVSPALRFIVLIHSHSLSHSSFVV